MHTPQHCYCGWNSRSSVCEHPNSLAYLILFVHDFQGASVAESVTYDVSSSHRTFYNVYFELIFASLTGSLSVTRTIVVVYRVGR